MSVLDREHVVSLEGDSRELRSARDEEEEEKEVWCTRLLSQGEKGSNPAILYQFSSLFVKFVVTLLLRDQVLSGSQVKTGKLLPYLAANSNNVLFSLCMSNNPISCALMYLIIL